jgi:hypothetical protein
MGYETIRQRFVFKRINREDVIRYNQNLRGSCGTKSMRIQNPGLFRKGIGEKYWQRSEYCRNNVSITIREDPIFSDANGSYYLQRHNRGLATKVTLATIEHAHSQGYKRATVELS